MCNSYDISIRESIKKKKLQSYGHFPYGGGGGAQPHSIAFCGEFSYFPTEAILDYLTPNSINFF